MEAFSAHERFELRERLGEGGFGTVYAAWDRELGVPVALKQLRHQSPDAIYRFKKEFRLLAEVAHPNLVSLYELFQSKADWYFTMELVPGRHILEHLRPDSEPLEQAATIRAVAPLTVRSPEPGPVRLRPRAPAPIPALDGLRSVFAQLARALCALHEAGLLHRDVKPSNVLVTPDGRVVVCDFGLATETRPLAAIAEGEVVGTPLYMSPEQWVAGQVTEASDWYSFGVVMYEALTGVPPFDGTASEIGAALFARKPLRPRAFNAAIPEPLSQLCHDLLKTNAQLRPSGPEVLRRLLGEDAAELHTDRPSYTFVDRQHEQAELRRALDSVCKGRAVVVELVGEAGLGKTALCEHFLSGLRDDPETLVLSGRSYEQESLPYKALDGVIDELSRVLLRRWHTTAGIWPEHVHELTRLFPVLGRVPGFGRGGSDEIDPKSALELRRDAVQALRQLLGELSRQQRIVLLLDDVHWGDVDSAVLLHQLLAPPGAPPMLVLLAYNSDEAEASPFLHELRALDAAIGTAGTERQKLVLSRIPPSDCEVLASTLLKRRRTRPGAVAELAREAAGNPLLLEELIRYAHDDGDRPTAARTPDVEERRALLTHMIGERIRELPEPWRRFLAVVALAARPIDVETAQQVADLPSIDRVLLNRLRTAHLLRTRHADGREQVAPYHDRICDIVVRDLGDDDKRRLHLGLAAVLAERDAPPGVIARHLAEAGNFDRAADYALRAAAQAEAALAFDEAAELYGKVLSWRKSDRRPLAAYAAALANAGRCAEAAPRFLEAAANVNGLPSLELKQRACEQYLMGGHTDEGLALLEELCATVDVPVPRSPRRTMLAMAADLARLKLRGLDFDERQSHEIDPTARFRIDLCYSASRNLMLRDPVAAVGFATRALRLALRAGEPSRVVEGLAGVGAALAATGSPMSEGMLTRARLIAERLGTPYVLGILKLWTAYVDHTNGRWTASLAAWEEAAELLRQCRGVQSEIQKAELNAILATQLLGRFDALSRMTERAAADARASGNRYTEVYARLYSSIPPLAAGQPDVARECIGEALARAPVGDHYVRVTALKFECYCDLYEGRAADGLARLQAVWKQLSGSRLMRSANFKMVFYALHAGLLLATRGADDRAALAEAEADARRCEAADYPYARGQTALLRSAIAAARGDTTRALGEVDTALGAFAAAQLPLETAYALRRRGKLIGGEAGEALVAEADAALREKGVADPMRWICSQAPGFPAPVK
jgi:serine/threonine protein kinase